MCPPRLFFSRLRPLERLGDTDTARHVGGHGRPGQLAQAQEVARVDHFKAPFSLSTAATTPQIPAAVPAIGPARAGARCAAATMLTEIPAQVLGSVSRLMMNENILPFLVAYQPLPLPVSNCP